MAYQFQQPLNPQNFNFGSQQQPTQFGVPGLTVPDAMPQTLAGGYGFMPNTVYGAQTMAGNADFFGTGFKPPGQASPFGVGGGSGQQAPGMFDGIGANMPTLKFGLEGIKTISDLIGSFKSQKLAQESFDFSKKYAETNLRNSTQGYNDRMEDRLNTRGMVAGTNKEDTAAEIQRRRLYA